MSVIHILKGFPGAGSGGTIIKLIQSIRAAAGTEVFKNFYKVKYKKINVSSPKWTTLSYVSLYINLKDEL